VFIVTQPVAAAAAGAEGLPEARHVRRDAEGLTEVARLEEGAVVREREPVRAGDVRDVVPARIPVDGDRRLAAEALVVDEH